MGMSGKVTETFHLKWWLLISSPMYFMKILTALLNLDAVNTYFYLHFTLAKLELRVILK